jgi:hypothetical protein
VALRPGELGGERLGGDEQGLLLLGQLRHGEADVGQEGAGEQGDALAGYQLVGENEGVRRLATIVAREHLERSAEHPARAVDFFDRELPSLAIREQECRDSSCRSRRS